VKSEIRPAATARQPGENKFKSMETPKWRKRGSEISPQRANNFDYCGDKGVSGGHFAGFTTEIIVPPLGGEAFQSVVCVRSFP
jgi:hypothetical protein